MNSHPLIVVALGGNAISRSDEEGNVDQQFANSRMTARTLTDLVESGCQPVVTHGNGPQIGNFLLRNEASPTGLYTLPMEVAVAHVQGGMGFMIAQTFTNELTHRGHDQAVATIITTILVDSDDPAFQDPGKPIGRTVTSDEADRFAADEGWSFKEVQPGKYRRVVPSPIPRRIMEIETIRRAVENGELLVTCGGGGIPVVCDPEKGLRGVAAVIDKDLASALLATELDAQTIMFLTDVEHVCIDFNTPNEQSVDRMTVDEAQGWLGEGQFPAGSMGPKVRAAIEFLCATDRPDAYVIIGPLRRAADAIAGKTGTRITKS